MINIPMTGEVTRCPMCGTLTGDGLIGLRYHHGVQYVGALDKVPSPPCSDMDAIASQGDDDEYQAFEEAMEHHLCRMCRCGYGWVERPVLGVPVHEQEPAEASDDA